MRLRAALAAALLLAACSGSDEDRGAPFLPISGEEAPMVEDGSPISTLVASIEDLPSAMESGGHLAFTVVLENPTDEPVRLDPCPAHEVSVGESSTSFDDGPWLLNCAEVPEVPAGSTRRFEVVVDVPDDFAEDGSSVTWHLVPVDAGVAVTLGTIDVVP